MKKIIKYWWILFVFGIIVTLFMLPLNINIKKETKAGFTHSIFSSSNYIREVKRSISNSKLDDGYYDISLFDDHVSLSKPKMGYIYIENSKIYKYGLYFDDYFESCINDTCYRENYNKEQLVSIKEFGALGDGASDDTIAIKNASKYISENGGILYFPTGKYIVSAEKNRDIIMDITGDKNIVIDFMGSTISLTKNGHARYSILKASYTDSVVVRNGILVGDRLTHDFSDRTSTAEHKTHEFGTGVYFNHTKYGLIYNIESYDFTGDSVCIRNSKSGGTMIIDQSHFHHSRRQGLTVLDADQVIVKNTVIHHIGTFDGVEGTLPKSGIDIEPDSASFMVNKIIFDNIDVYEVDGYGLIANKTWHGDIMPTPDITISNSRIEKPCLSYSVVKDTVLNFTRPTAILLGECDIVNSIFNMDSSGSSLFMEGGRVDNSIFQSLADPGEINGKIYFYGTVVTNSKFTDIKGRDNVNTRSNADFGIVLFADQGAFGEGSYNNEFHNCNIYGRGDVNLDYSKIYDSVFLATTSMNLVGVEIYGGRTMSGPEVLVEMRDCIMIDAGTFENSKKVMDYSYLEVSDVGNIFAENSELNNTTIVIKGKTMINCFLLVSSINNSQIIVYNYSKERKFDNKYIENLNDYISCLGTRKLTYYLN